VEEYMDIKETYFRLAKWISPRVLTKVADIAKRIPAVNRLIEREYAEIESEMRRMLKPYKGRFPTVSRIPEEGWPRERVIADMEAVNLLEEPRWKDGYASGAVYHGDDEHVKFLCRVYELNSQSNPLHSDLWPSTAKYEAEIVSMVAGMVGADAVDAGPKGKDGVCGVVTSGGTESIMLAMKAYRDWARKEKGIRRPEMVVPVTAHAAFDKAAECFGIRIRHVPVGADCRADVREASKAVNRNTIVLAGSAPPFPHGTIDPIKDLSELARRNGIGFHTDACLGGFILPWAEELGYEVPPFDFRLAGVTSMSVDTHKFGYASKGTSVVLYRGYELRHYQYFKATDWPGGVYFTPTLAGSRPGALSAACWAAMLSTGRNGYLDATRKVLETADTIKEGIRRIPELFILGDPLWVIAFGSKNLDIYEVMEHMAEKGWSLNGLQNPSCVHICVTLRHTQTGVAERFLEDLESAVRSAERGPKGKGSKLAMYGVAATFPDRRLVGEALDMFLDTLYEV
jgi:sphinganine-1-phosphate aldolase